MFFSRYKYVFLLMSATLLWGTTFVVVQEAVESIPVMLFIAARFLVALLVILPFLKGRMKEVRQSFLPGLAVGFVLFLAYASQTFGLKWTTAANSAFITGLNFVFTPLLGVLLFKIKVRRQVLYAVVLALMGFTLLSYNPGMRFNPGDFMTLICSLSVALQILLLDYYLKKGVSEFGLFFYQIFFVAFFSLTASLIFEPFNLKALSGGYSIFAVLFTGIFCSAYGFFAQTRSQKHIPPVRAALIFILEPVFGAILDFYLNGMAPALKLTGGALILAALVLGEIRRKEEQP